MSYLIEPPVRVMPLTLSPREDQVTAINVVNNNNKKLPQISGGIKWLLIIKNCNSKYHFRVYEKQRTSLGDRSRRFSRNLRGPTPGIMV